MRFRTMPTADTIRLNSPKGLLVMLFLWPFLSVAQITTTTTADISRCVAGSNQLLTTPSGGTSYSYSWTPAASLSNASIANPVASPTVTTTYVVTVTDVPTSNTVTDTVTITIQNIPPPLAISPQFDTICQGDTASLDVANFPYCQSVQGTCQGPTSTQTLGSGISLSFTQADNPFFKTNTFFQQVRSAKHQYIFKKSELNALGMTGPTTISSIAWDMMVNFGSHTYTNVELKMGCTSDTVLSNLFKTGLTTVYSQASRTFSSTQWEQFAFLNPYVWDGQSNIVMEVCYSNSSASNGFPWVRFDVYNSNIASYSAANSNVCANTAANLTNRRPNTRFVHCQLTHNTGLTYSWTPAAGLSSTSIRNPSASPSVTTSYILTATDNNGCWVQDTSVISVAPNFNLTINSDTSLCLEDTLALSAMHNAGAGASVQWTSKSWIEADTAQNTRGFFNQNDKVFIGVESAAGCLKTDSFDVFLVSPVEVDILTEDTTICVGDTIPIQVSTNSQNCAVYSNAACINPGTLSFPGTSAFPTGGITVSPFDAQGTLSSPGQKKQLLFTASEFAALTNSTTISKIGFNIQSITTTNTSRQGFTIKMGCTSLSSFPFGVSNFETGLQTVYTPKTINVGTGWNDFIFDNNFIWDGSSNVIVEICWQNSSSLGFGLTTLSYTITSFTSVLINWNSTNYCSEASGSFATTIRPDMRFGHCTSPPNPNFDYLWTPSTALSSDTVPEPLAFPGTTTQYVLDVVDPSTGCSDADTIILSTAPDFNTSVTGDSTLCSPDSVMLNVSHTSTSAVTYNWMPSSEVTDSSIASPWTYADGPKTIVSEVKSLLGCIKWDTVNLGLFDQLNLNIIPPAGLNCEGDSLQFDSDVSLACGQSTSNLCNPSSNLVLGNSTSSSGLFNVTPFIGSNPSSKKQYLIRKTELVNAGASGSTQLAGISFDVAAVGKSDFENFSIKIGCTNTSSMGSAFLTGGVLVFEPKDVTLTSGKNWFNFDYRFNWDGQSNIFIEICYNNSSTGTNSTIYYTQPSPVFNCTVYARGNSVCNNSNGTAYNRRPNIEFKYCGVNSASYTYSWSPQNWFNDPGLSNPKAIANIPSWYKLSLTDQQTNCIVEDSVQLNVKSFEVNALEDTSLCSTEGFKLDVNTTAILPTYQWTPTNQLSNDTIRRPTILVPNGVNYIIEVTDSSGCSKSDTVDISLLPQPNANASPKSIDVCRFEDVQLTGSGGQDFEWSPGQFLNDSNIAFPVANVFDTTVLYLTVTNSFGCTDQDSVVINVYPSPILDLGPDTSYCNGGFIALDAGSAFTGYLWQDNSTLQSFLVESDGKFWVSVEDAYQCKFSDTVRIDVAPSPQGDFTWHTELCIGDSVVLDALNPGSIYKWSTGENTQQITAKDSGKYWVEIDDGTCIGIDSTFITLYQYPESYLEDNTFYCEKENPFGYALAAGPEEYKYKWSTGQVTPVIVVTKEGLYTVEIINGGRCKVEKSTQVRQVCSEVIYVPNTFTPNSDWKNDYFSIVATNMDEFEFRIFNRWGEEIFYSENPEFKWDGRLNGKELPEGVYVWRLDYTMKMPDGSFDEREEKGSLTLIR